MIQNTHLGKVRYILTTLTHSKFEPNFKYVRSKQTSCSRLVQHGEGSTIFSLFSLERQILTTHCTIIHIFVHYGT